MDPLQAKSECQGDRRIPFCGTLRKSISILQRLSTGVWVYKEGASRWKILLKATGRKCYRKTHKTVTNMERLKSDDRFIAGCLPTGIGEEEGVFSSCFSFDAIWSRSSRSSSNKATREQRKQALRTNSQRMNKLKATEYNVTCLPGPHM